MAGAAPTVETLRSRVELLVLERQRLRSAGATAAELEQNRLRLVRAQHELAHELISRHLPAA